MKNILSKFAPYLIVLLLSFITFCITFRIWGIDIKLPIFLYKDDTLFNIFLIKNIIDTGGFFQNHLVGLPHLAETFNLYDFPMQYDLFSIAILKFFTLFSHNPFLITNIFFITTFLLVSLTAFIALRSFNISIFCASLFSVIYAFLPYHMIRNVRHLFLSNYMIIPLSAMVCFWIINNKLKVINKDNNGTYNISLNKYFIIAALISFFCVINNIYYAYYSCIIFIFAWLISSLKSGSFLNKNAVAPIILCILCLTTVLVLYTPSLLYSVQHGHNNYILTRATSESERYALRIFDLLIPVTNHYIDYLANIRLSFFTKDMERVAESLGILGSAGFIFLLFWIIGNNHNSKLSVINKTINKLNLDHKEQSFISDLAKLNLLSIFFATAGGLVMFISISAPMLRSHARFCLFIAFFSLSLIALISDKTLQKYCKNKAKAKIALFIIFVLTILDQTGNLSSSYTQPQELINKYNNDRQFIAKIEQELPTGSAVMMLPVFAFPIYKDNNYKSLTGYIHSDNLKWSYPVIRGRESYDWQKSLDILPLSQMITKIKQAGFKGLYVNKTQYIKKYGQKNYQGLKDYLSSPNDSSTFESPNKNLIFFTL